ncbi:MAG: polyphosphate--glucose phosphotransferase [Anaerolineae bacterium]
MEVLGIDVGGTGIKGAPVNIDTGQFSAERYRLLTPRPATPEAMIATIAEIVQHFNWKGLVGCGFPSAIKGGVVCTAANISEEWIGLNAQEALHDLTQCPLVVINDADAAGLAELRFGAGRDQQGLILVVTLGTGIGTALFVDGRLVPNTEFGHIEIRGMEAEDRAAAVVREQEKLSWKKWASRLDEYLTTMERLVWPDLIIVGGGISKKHHKFLPHLTVQTRVVPAQMRNQAGIVGAALAAVV